MELGMFTSGYQRYPLERAFSDAGRLGYDYIELWGGRPHAFAPDLRLGGVAEIRSMVEKYQMPVYVYTPEHTPTTIWSEDAPSGRTAWNIWSCVWRWGRP